MPGRSHAQLFGVSGWTTSIGHGRAGGIVGRVDPLPSASLRPDRLLQRRVADGLVPGMRVEPTRLTSLSRAKTVHLLAPSAPPPCGGSSG